MSDGNWSTATRGARAARASHARAAIPGELPGQPYGGSASQDLPVEQAPGWDAESAGHRAEVVEGGCCGAAFPVGHGLPVPADHLGQSFLTHTLLAT